MIKWRLILYPFSVLYDGITRVRNWAFDKGLLVSKSYDIPVIAVGNLSTGGTGKTPMVEYLIDLLANKRVAVLSRGYGRKTRGFKYVGTDSLPKEVGDEPAQIKQKFGNSIISAVCESRVEGIDRIISENTVDVIILDDAYQHRYVKASDYILLTSYDKLYSDDFVLPAGDLRESRKGASRATCIVVTKCPVNLTDQNRLEIKKKLRVLPEQKLFFSYIDYQQNVISEGELLPLKSLDNQTIAAVAGIAKPAFFFKHLKENLNNVVTYTYQDHFDYNHSMLQNWSEDVIITTEKDYVKLQKFDQPNLFYLPIKNKFLGNKLELNDLNI
ncbi:MAG: tetraacyldisaccharide 4'-kinase [Bacteroidota bacterium]|nr:tetraacyldisaccharide 4'-kinase [Bacteroidota bacterium]